GERGPTGSTAGARSRSEPGRAPGVGAAVAARSAARPRLFLVPGPRRAGALWRAAGVVPGGVLVVRGPMPGLSAPLGRFPRSVAGPQRTLLVLLAPFRGLSAQQSRPALAGRVNCRRFPRLLQPPSGGLPRSGAGPPLQRG